MGERYDDTGPDPFVTAARARRAQMGPRVLLAGVVALVFSNVIGLTVCAIWLGVYLTVCLTEHFLITPVVARDERVRPVRKILALGAFFVSAAVFGSLSVPLWVVGGPLGGVIGSFLLSAAVMHVVTGTPASRAAIACSILPHAGYMVTIPLFVRYFGGGQPYAEATLAGAVFFLLNGLFAWAAVDRARRAEADARAVSERKRREAEAAVAAKSAFVATVSHELRTPISALTAGAAALEAAHRNGAGKSDAALIADAARMMKTLLDDLLDHAKLDAGRMSVEAEPFDLRAQLAQTVRFWTAEARKKGLRLRVEGARAMPRGVVGDATRLRQILNNLLSNAIKFTAEGDVTLRLAAWPQDEERVSLTLQVADTGRGMSKTALNRLFQPFEQAEAGDGRDLGGTGLGLAISRQLAELMGGKLTAISAEGRGSAFTLALTLKTTVLRAGNAPATRAVEADAAPISVLVVDDHEINRRAVTLMLQPLGVRVAAADSGAAALEMTDAQRFDVILMDVRMPGLDGRETARRIRSGTGPNAFTPIVAVTADGEDADREACRLAGMSDFVAKPIDPTALIECVDRAVTQPYSGTNSGSAAGSRAVA